VHISCGDATHRTKAACIAPQRHAASLRTRLSSNKLPQAALATLHPQRTFSPPCTSLGPTHLDTWASLRSPRLLPRPLLGYSLTHIPPCTCLSGHATDPPTTPPAPSGPPAAHLLSPHLVPSLRAQPRHPNHYRPCPAAPSLPSKIYGHPPWPLTLYNLASSSVPARRCNSTEPPGPRPPSPLPAWLLAPSTARAGPGCPSPMPAPTMPSHSTDDYKPATGPGSVAVWLPSPLQRPALLSAFTPLSPPTASSALLLRPPPRLLPLTNAWLASCPPSP
jgi:hypothetical protein